MSAFTFNYLDLCLCNCCFYLRYSITITISVYDTIRKNQSCSIRVVHAYIDILLLEINSFLFLNPY